MAIQSLFGPSIADIQELRRQQAEKEIAGAGQEFGVFAPLYQAGLRFGNQAVSGINTLMGVQDPRLQEATAIQSVLSKYSEQDLNDPTVLSQMSQEFTQLGRPQQAFMLAQQANKLKEQNLDRELRQKQFGLIERQVIVAEENARENKYKNNPELLIEEARALPEDDPRKQTLINRYYQIKQEEQLKVQKTQAEIDRLKAETLAKISLRAGGPQEYNNNGVPMGRVDSKGIFYDNRGQKVGEKAFTDAEQSHNSAQDLLISLRQISEQDINDAYGSVADYTQSDTGKLIGAQFASTTQKAQYKINQVGVKNILENLQKLKGASTDKEMQRVASTFPGYQAKPDVMKAWIDDAIETTNRFLKRSETRYGFDTEYERENRFGTKSASQRSPAVGEIPPGVSVKQINGPR